MLSALCEDLIQTGRYRVSTTLDQRITTRLPDVDVHAVHSPEQEWEDFQRLASETDEVYLIAPELDGILQHRVEYLTQINRADWHCSSDALAITADKWEFFRWGHELGLSIPTTKRVEQINILPEPEDYPFILKPSFGAGATATRRIVNFDDWHRFWNEYSLEEEGPFIQQPWIDGEPISLVCFVDAERKNIQYTPLAAQHFEGLTYRGGTMPVHPELEPAAFQIAHKVIENLRGLRGYVGFDFLLHPSAETPLTLLEVNPRLTSSYLGYRKLAKHSLIPWLSGKSETGDISWETAPISFQLTSELSR